MTVQTRRYALLGALLAVLAVVAWLAPIVAVIFAVVGGFAYYKALHSKDDEKATHT